LRFFNLFFFFVVSFAFIPLVFESSLLFRFVAFLFVFLRDRRVGMLVEQTSLPDGLE
jgi:hypothetical protein